jgi:hypothetical protein
MTPIPGTIAGQRLQAKLGVLPNPGSMEPPAFVTLVSSGGGRHTEPVTVVAAAAVNHAPVALADTATTAEDTAVVIPVLANDSDVDNVAPTAPNAGLAVTGVSGATGGTATVLADGTVRFTPALNFNGTGSFNYAISDGNGGTASASATVTVTPVNDPPVARNDTFATAAGTPVTMNVLANDSDVEGTALTVFSVTQPAAGGSVTNNGTTVTFTPTAGFSGTATFTYVAQDSGIPLPAAVSAPATVTVTVAPPPPPVDLDIARFSAPANGRVGRALAAVTVNVNNGGTVNGIRNATLTGTRNGVQVYNRTLQVSDPVGGGSSQFAFPAYTPTATGNITWRVEIFDDAPDVDVATATTAVPR